MNQERMNEILQQYDHKVENLLPILLDVQEAVEGKYISPETADYLATQLNIPNAQMSEVITFFAAIHTEPKGKFHIEMCESTVCKVNESHLIEEFLMEYLHIDFGETTTDGLFSLDHAPCFGACDVAPSIRINKKAYGHLTIDKVKQILSRLKEAQ